MQKKMKEGLLRDISRVGVKVCPDPNYVLRLPVPDFLTVCGFLCTIKKDQDRLIFYLLHDGKSGSVVVKDFMNQ